MTAPSRRDQAKAFRVLRGAFTRAVRRGFKPGRRVIPPAALKLTYAMAGCW